MAKTQQQMTQAEFEQQLRKKATKGNAEACYQLVEYAEQSGTAENMLEAQNRINLLVTASNKGYAAASLLLGRWYLQGHYVDADAAKAILFFEHAGKHGESMGYYQLAHMFQTGSGVPANESKGLEYLNKAIDMGNADAALTLATQVLATDPKQAFKLLSENYKQKQHFNSLIFLVERPEFEQDKVMAFLHEQAEQNPVVQAILASRYVQQQDFEKALPFADFAEQHNQPLGAYVRSLIEFNREPVNVELAQQYLLKAAQLGHPEASYRIGVDLLQYASEQQEFANAEQILKQAINYIAQAAQQGHAAAQYSLGQCWSQGLGVEQNLQEALAWLERSARQGNVDAMFSLAVHLPMNHELHLPWLQAAAQAGHSKAVLCRGLYDQQQNQFETAVEWFKQAEQLGEVRATYLLGMAYLNGQGLAADSKKAVELLNTAGEKGDVDAYFSLYKAYRDGTGVRKNKKSQAKYLKLAKAGNHPEAAEIEE